VPNTKAKALAALVNKNMGKGTIGFASDPYYKVDYLPTEITPIDDLLGGGIPFGRFVEIFGNYSTLKTYVGLRAIASCQRRGGLAGLIDPEHAFDPKWAKDCGVDVDNLVLKQPATAEQAVDISEVLIRGGCNLIVFDSIAAALPKAEKDIMLSGDKNIQPARLAALMSVAMRKLTTANRKTAMIWINQTRLNVGVVFGNPETTPGGKAMGFFASMRLALRKAGVVTEQVEVHIMEKNVPKKKKFNRVVGVTIRATLEKSKLNQPHRDVMFNFDFREATIDEWFYLATQALDCGAVEYDKGLWWIPNTATNKKAVGSLAGKKFRGREAFQKKMSEKQLLVLLGHAQPDKRRVVQRRKKKRSVAVPNSTLDRVQAGSRTTQTTKKRSTKSKTPTRRSR
jgi:recombination protein RecA